MSVGWKLGGVVGLPRTPLALLLFLPGQNVHSANLRLLFPTEKYENCAVYILGFFISLEAILCLFSHHALN